MWDKMLIFNGKMEFVYLGNSDEFKKLYCKYLLSKAKLEFGTFTLVDVGKPINLDKTACCRDENC